MKRATRGFGIIEGLAIVLAISLVGAVGYIAYDKIVDKDKGNDSITTAVETDDAKTATDEKKQKVADPKLTKTTVTPIDGSVLDVSLPDGWTKEADHKLVKTIDGVQYVISFQSEENDLLQGNYGGNAETLKDTKTATGATRYVIKTGNGQYVSLSASQPINGNGTSLSYNSKSLLVLMYTYQPGDQYVREIDFSSPTADTAIKDFETIASSLNV